MNTVVLQVEGMSCSHCVQAVEGALKKLDGVISAKVSLEEKKVTVEYDENRVSIEAMKASIEDQGYEVK